MAAIGHSLLRYVYALADNYLGGIMNIIKTTLAALCLSATSAAAIPVGWSFNTVSVGGTIGGSFVYDADTSMFSNFNITSTIAGGSPVAVNNLYAFFSPILPILWSTPTPTVGGIWVSIDVRSPLTNAGGTASAIVSGITCNRIGTNTQGCNGGRGIGGAGLTTLTSFVPPAAVPLPATGALLLSGFAALGWGAARRRKSPGALATA